MRSTGRGISWQMVGKGCSVESGASRIRVFYPVKFFVAHIPCMSSAHRLDSQSPSVSVKNRHHLSVAGCHVKFLFINVPCFEFQETCLSIDLHALLYGREEAVRQSASLVYICFSSHPHVISPREPGQCLEACSRVLNPDCLYARFHPA